MRFRGVQSRRTAAHSPLYISPKQPDHKSVCLFFINTIQTRVVTQSTLHPPPTSITIFPLPPSPPLAAPPPCREATLWPLWFPSSGVRRDDRWAGAIWLPPVAREEAAGVEVVNIRLRHINVPICVNAAAESRRWLPALAPGSSSPASHHIADS